MICNIYERHQIKYCTNLKPEIKIIACACMSGVEVTDYVNL